MNKSNVRIILAAVVGSLAASGANATIWDYNFKSNTTVGTNSYVYATSKYVSPTTSNYLTFTDTTNASKLTLNVFGGHINSTKSTTNAALNTVSNATVADWRNYGLGVAFGNDNVNDETHQIDNSAPGIDFVALVFDKAVSLSTIGITAYELGTTKSIDYDLSYVAYTGALSDIANGLKLSTFSTIAAAGKTWTTTANEVASLSATVPVNGAVTSKIWLVSAAIVSPDAQLDGFKITSLSVSSVPASVPEPATWAMMLVGFGAIGGTLRSRRVRVSMDAAIRG